MSQRCSIKELFWKTSQNSQINTRSSHPKVFCQKMFLKILQNSQKNHFCRSLHFNKVASWKPWTGRSSCWRSPVKQGVLKNFPNFAGKNLCWSLFLINLEFWAPKTLLKKTQAQVFSCEIYKPFKNNYFQEHLWTSASASLFGDSKKVLSCEFCKLFKNTYFLEDLQTASSETSVRTASSETSMRKFFFNKVASLTAWRLLTVLERDCRRDISL